MRFIAALIILTGMTCAEPKEIAQQSKEVLSNLPDHVDIAFYNVENLFDVRNDPRKDDDDFTPDGENEWSQGRYEKKLINLSKVIQAMDHGEGLPAIIGLAEVENDEVVQALGNTILPSGYGVVTENSQDHRGIDVALLFYRKDMINIISHETLRIDFDERGYTSRDILYVDLSIVGQERMHVYLNHWPSRRGGQAETEHRRLNAAETLKASVDQVKDSDAQAQIIILGDFNDYPDNRSITEVLSAKADNSRKSGELVNLAYDDEMDGKGTYPYKGDWGMLDQAIVSDELFEKKGLYLDEGSMDIFKEDFMMFYDKKYKEYKPNRTYGGPKYYGGFSDHLPILLHLKLANN